MQQKFTQVITILALALSLTPGNAFTAAVPAQNTDPNAAATAQSAPESYAPALTLEQYYELALKRSENLQIQNETLIEMQHRYGRARASIYPSLSFNASEFVQDTSNTSSDDQASNSFAKGERPEMKFTLEQPIFTGFRELHTSRALRFQQEGIQDSIKRARQALFEEVATAFYNVERGKTDLRNTQEIISLIRARVKELQKREQIGQSRKSEILTVESQYAALLAQEQENIGFLRNARLTLSFLSGLPENAIQTQDGISRVTTIDAQDKFQQRANSRSDVQALVKEVSAQEQLLKTAKGALYPRAWATANYYLKRTGFQEIIDWDAMFNLSVPLFEGGALRLQVREAESRLRRAQLGLHLLQRQIANAIAKSYVDLQTSVARQDALEESYNKARESYKLQSQEYRNGLVNNLEVLESLNALQRARENFDRSIIQTKLNLIKLKVASEELP